MNFELPRNVTRIWDLAVPIIISESGIDAYIQDEIGEPSYYSELCHILRSTPKGMTVNLHINTPGGMIDSATQIIDAITESKAKVVARLTGTVASAGTIIALSCDEVIPAAHLSFMIHNYSAGLYGKGHEMKARQEFMDKSLNTSFKSFYAGFLTEKEMEDVIDGKDIWIGTEEVAERWANRKALLKLATKRVAKKAE